MTTPRDEQPIYVPGPYDQPTAAQSPGPAAPRRRTGLVVGLAIVIALGAAAAGITYVLQAAGRMTVHGSVTIRGASSIAVSSLDGSTCGGKDGYDDLAAGGSVNITDSGTATVALGRLDAGRYDSTQGCILTWTVHGVPTGKGFYGIAVGHRAAIKVPESQMRHEVALTIG